MAKTKRAGAKPSARSKTPPKKAAPKRQSKRAVAAVLGKGPIRRAARPVVQPRLTGVESDPRLKTLDGMHADLYRILVRQSEDRADAEGLKQGIQNEMIRLSVASRTSHGVVSKCSRVTNEWDFSAKLADPAGKKTGKVGGSSAVDTTMRPADLNAMDAVDDGPRDTGSEDDPSDVGFPDDSGEEMAD